MSAGERNPWWWGDSLLETLLLLGLAFGLVGSATLWLVGQVAALAFSQTWPDVPFSAMGGVLVRFVQAPGDPAGAWPAPADGLLPGAVGFYAVAILLLAPIVGGAALAVRLRGGTRRRVDPDAARWASPAELRPLVVKEPTRGRVTLGVAGRRLLAAEARQSAIVFGPTQTGKTTGLAIPAILEWDGPVVCTSVKTDLLRDTLARRRERGEVLLFDPAGATGLRGHAWTPLAASRDWSGAQRTAASLCNAARLGRAQTANDEFWFQMAAKLLAPHLFAAANGGATMRDLVRWIDRRDMQTPGRLLDQIGDEDARDAADASWARDEKTLSSVYATTEAVVIPFADPHVERATRRAEIDPQRLLDGGRPTLYLSAPSHEQERLAPLFATLVMDIVHAVYARASRTGRPLDPPLLLVLDEAANIAPIHRLDTIASTAAGQGLQLLSVFQDVAQVREVYGDRRAASIVSNHRAKLILSGIADQSTLDYVARLLGDEDVSRVSTSRDSDGRHSTSESEAQRALAPANVLRQIRPGEGVLVYGHLPPMRVRLRPWWVRRNDWARTNRPRA